MGIRSYAVENGRPLAAGLTVGLALTIVHFLVGREVSVATASITLSVIAGAYFGFAVRDGRPRVILIETVVCLLFGAAALAGLLGSALWIPAAIVVHGIWDWLHHLPSLKCEVPHGYPLFCLLVDLILGGVLFVLYMS